MNEVSFVLIFIEKTWLKLVLGSVLTSPVIPLTPDLAFPAPILITLPSHYNYQGRSLASLLLSLTWFIS